MGVKPEVGHIYIENDPVIDLLWHSANYFAPNSSPGTTSAGRTSVQAQNQLELHEAHVPRANINVK